MVYSRRRVKGSIGAGDGTSAAEWTKAVAKHNGVLGLTLEKIIFPEHPFPHKPRLLHHPLRRRIARSTTASTRSRWAHSANTAPAAILTAAVAIPLPQCSDPTTYPISARHRLFPQNGLTDTEPTARPDTHMALCHGCGITVVAT
ncbi:glucose-repressible alcohol dehydrogenasetranscriptional effector [Striga asiatica]|uniref:Glucose-repressible alcohol dehydrogenasetranscriptional effector n=1 Tax=Striga asiatica TaxID=4170 RepID=A0A5A7PNP6_STRAF|nr:glucose-repressible alcohol dehydrogenasetranscriptional effector [Striga asiatica]